MALKYLLDEHLRGPLWLAIQRHNARGIDSIDVVRVGDADCPPLGTTDPEILRWAEQADRVLLTLDEHTLPRHLEVHLKAGHHVPGILTIRPRRPLQEILEFLVLTALVTESAECADRITYIP